MLKIYRNIPRIFITLTLCFLAACAKTDSVSIIETDFPLLEIQLPTTTHSDAPSSPVNPDLVLDLPSGLILEAYQLKRPPEAMPTIFTPLVHTQEEVLARHAAQRNQRTTQQVEASVTGMSMSADDGDQTITAKEVYPDLSLLEPGQLDKNANIQIEVSLNEETIYTARTGDISPIPPLQGIWLYEDHYWTLEYAYITTTISETLNTVFTDAAGQIVIDGISVNDTHGYEEAFSFQMIASRPFYFFKMDGEIGINYAGETQMLPFEAVSHYNCCSAALLNPIQAQNMVAFFAEADGTWYYVEIGTFE